MALAVVVVVHVHEAGTGVVDLDAFQVIQSLVEAVEGVGRFHVIVAITGGTGVRILDEALALTSGAGAGIRVVGIRVVSGIRAGIVARIRAVRVAVGRVDAEGGG